MSVKKVPDKKDAISLAIENLEKQISGNKKESIIRKASDRTLVDKKELIPFGIEELDKASFCGGIPRGKMVELFGPESSGKSYISLKLIASAQKLGITCCLLDVEQSFDPIWALNNGIDLDKLYVISAQLTGEEYLNYLNGLIESGQFGLLILDSTAALMPSDEMNNEIGKNSVALLARLMSQACKKIMTNCAHHNATAVFINQIRDKPGVMFGNPETTPGGRALKFYSHIRMSVFPGGYEKEMRMVNGKEEEFPVSKKASITFVKNKVARPYGKAAIQIYFDKDANNPFVFFAKSCKDAGLVRLYNGEFTVSKELIEDAKKNVPTGARSYAELAHYIKRNNLIELMLEKLVEKHDAGGVVVSKEVLGLADDLEYLDTLALPEIADEYRAILEKGNPSEGEVNAEDSEEELEEDSE